MSLSFIQKHPRIVWFAIGLLVSLIIGSVITRWADLTINEYKEINSKIVEEYKQKTIEQSSKIEKLYTENQKLKQSKKTYKIVKPDGTIEERTESEMESETSIAESVKEEYYQKLHEETSKIHKEYSEKIEKITTEHKKLNVEAGVTLNMDYYVHGSYAIYNRFSIGAGMLFPTTSYLFGVGISL
jgi:uncharacterized membrane-anchored protein YhcB (DUF1043 family)